MRRHLLRILGMGSVAVVLSAPEPSPARMPATSPGWQAPVAGELLRAFDAGAHRFARGAHRGIDLSARPGAPVESPCAGRVAFAGPVARRRVVTVACGSWRVTHLPMGLVTVAAGSRVRRGQAMGTVASDDAHPGLHVGVRHAEDRSAYVDPWPLLDRHAQDGPGAVGVRRPPAGRAPRTRGRPRVPAPSPRVAAAPGRLRSAPAAVAPVAGSERNPLAPPLAWVGLAVLLAGVAQTPRHRQPRVIRLRAKEPATRPR